MQPYWTNGRQTIYCGDWRTMPLPTDFGIALLDPPAEVAPFFCSLAARQVYFGLPVSEHIEQVAALKPDTVSLWMPKLPLRIKAKLSMRQILMPVWAWGIPNVAPLYTDALNPEDGAEKPVSLLKELLWNPYYLAAPYSVLDPFMGTGNSLLACKELGIEAVGVEMDEVKCAIAAKKLEAV